MIGTHPPAFKCKAEADMRRIGQGVSDNIPLHAGYQLQPQNCDQAFAPFRAVLTTIDFPQSWQTGALRFVAPCRCSIRAKASRSV